MQEHEKGAHRGTGNILSIFSRSSGKEVAGFWLLTKHLFLLLSLAFLISPIFIIPSFGATLTVQLPGNGTGTVNSSPSGITCPSDCTGDFTTVTLLANPAGDSIFSGWGGACAGRENCSLTLSGAATVTALFTLKTTPVQVGGSYYGALQKACDKVAAGGVVMAVAQDQPGDLTLNKGISITLRGGYDAGFSSNADNITDVNGTVSLTTGSMTVENIAIGQSVPSPTAAPANIVATPGSGQVSLSWGAVGSATSYNVYYSTSTGVTRATGTKVTGTSSLSKVVTGLTNGITYYFVVTAVSANGESVESAQVIIAPVEPLPPPPPSSVLAISDNGQVTVSWPPVTGASSYNIYYSNSSAVSKANGTRITGATSPRAVALANNSTYWFVVTAVGAGGESVESSPAVPATPVVPPAADLVGTWNFIRFASGPGVTNGTEPGWMRGNATVAANGTVTVNSILDSSGGNTTPPVGTFAWTMNASGVVTQAGESALDTGNHGFMAANRQIIAGTGSIGNDRAIYICVKQVPGVTFSNADLTGPASFVMHQLKSGGNNEWEYGTGTINSSRQITLTSMTEPSGPGPLPPANFSTLSLSGTGIMTASDNNTSQGVMTPDKKNIFVTETTDDGPDTFYTFRVIQISGQTFAQSDMAGTWRTHSLISSTATPEWEYSTVSITNTGVLTTLEYLDSTGDNDPSGPGFTVKLGSSGTITVQGNDTLNGKMSYNKNMAVITETSDIGIGYFLMIILK